MALMLNWPAGKEVMRVRQRKRFGKFYCCIFPSLTNRWKTNARREPRCNHNDPFVRQRTRKADAAFHKCSARCQGQIFSTLEKLEVLAPKLQQALS